MDNQVPAIAEINVETEEVRGRGDLSGVGARPCYQQYTRCRVAACSRDSGCLVVRPHLLILTINLNSIIDIRQSSASNILAPSSSKSVLEPIIGPSGDSGAVLSSDPDVDAQILISVAFQSAVKVFSIAFKADTNSPQNASGPAKVHVFVDRPSLDFSEASSTTPVQTLNLSEQQLSGSPIPLRFVKFQNVHSIQLFVEDNHDQEDVTFINRIVFQGAPLQGMNMGDFKDQNADHDH